MRKESIRFIVYLVGIFIGLSLGVKGGGIERFLIFGDSLSDVGNCYELSQGGHPDLDHYYDGRYSNGQLWHEHLGYIMGLESSAWMRGGWNYAVAGATSDEGKQDDGMPNVGTEIDIFEREHGVIPEGTLVILWVGGNDFRKGIPLGTIPNIVRHIKRLARMGGRQFLVPGMLDLLMVPALSKEVPEEIDKRLKDYLKRHLDDDIASFWVDEVPILKIGLDLISRLTNTERMLGSPKERLTEVMQSYNTYMELELLGLSELLEVDIYYLDVHGLMGDIKGRPGLYGIRHIEGRAIDPNSKVLHEDHLGFMFIDAIHPTTTFHRAIGESACDLINCRENG